MFGKRISTGLVLRHVVGAETPTVKMDEVPSRVVVQRAGFTGSIACSFVNGLPTSRTGTTAIVPPGIGAPRIMFSEVPCPTFDRFKCQDCPGRSSL